MRIRLRVFISFKDDQVESINNILINGHKLTQPDPKRLEEVMI